VKYFVIGVLKSCTYIWKNNRVYSS